MSETISCVINDIAMDDIIFKNDSFGKAFSWAPYSDIYNRPETGPFFMPTIEKVIFNPPATIVFWRDETKTVVKCGIGEHYDSEKGLAMAISKKVLGNKGNYYNEFRKWLSDGQEEPATIENEIRSALRAFAKRYPWYGGDNK